MSETIVLVHKYNTELSSYRVKKFRKIRERLGYFSSRKSNHTLETIGPLIDDIRKFHPTSGARDMHDLLLVEKNATVKR